MDPTEAVAGAFGRLIDREAGRLSIRELAQAVGGNRRLAELTGVGIREVQLWQSQGKQRRNPGPRSRERLQELAREQAARDVARRIGERGLRVRFEGTLVVVSPDRRRRQHEAAIEPDAAGMAELQAALAVGDAATLTDALETAFFGADGWNMPDGTVFDDVAALDLGIP